jgi:hypothetical protein
MSLDPTEGLRLYGEAMGDSRSNPPPPPPESRLDLTPGRLGRTTGHYVDPDVPEGARGPKRRNRHRRTVWSSTLGCRSQQHS